MIGGAFYFQAGALACVLIGGGAPLKDNNGNNISNLKKVANGSVEVDHSASPVGRKYNNKYRQEDDYDSEDNYNRSNNRRRDDDRKPANKYAQEAQHASVSPKKGIGSFTNINNHMPDSEREAKRRYFLQTQLVSKFLMTKSHNTEKNKSFRTV